MTMGTALHLQCGPHRFVLGGRDHRIATGTRLEAPPVPGVDAYVSAADFGELLTMVGRRSGSDLRQPPPGQPTSPGQPTRCLLFPNPLSAQQMGPFAVLKKQRHLRSAQQPRLAIDVGADGIRVIDPNSNALIASAGLGQVTATPETYRYQRRGLLFGPPDQVASRVLDQAVAEFASTAPGLVVCVPGLQPLTIGCLDRAGSAGFTRRFSWRGQVPQRVNEPADYAVSGADWLMLVEKFGLAPSLETHG
jgi:hypothetical protein